MSLSIAVLADDLTGAADTAVAFARPGHPVPLHLHPAAPTAAVSAVDLDVRDADADVDVRAIYASQAARLGADQDLYVKIDSTLRGRVREQLAGVAEALPGRPMICAPAFPAVGRTVRGTVVHVHGLALHRSSVWRTEHRPAPRSLAEILPFAPTAVVGVDAIHSGRLDTMLADAAPLIVCDTTDDRDLARIARAGRSARGPLIWVGSAGLAAALAADRLGPSTGIGHAGRPSRFLAVVGSATAQARGQVEALVGAGATWFALAPADLDAPATVSPQAVAEAAATGPVVVSLTGPVDLAAHRPALSAALARLVAPALAATELVVLTGGATARAVLTACEIASLDVHHELGPGIVESVAPGGPPPRIVTKAGAFGDERTLVDLLYPSCRRIGAI